MLQEHHLNLLSGIKGTTMKNTGCRCEHNTKVSFSFSPSCFHAFSWFSSSTSVGDVDRVASEIGALFLYIIRLHF